MKCYFCNTKYCQYWDFEFCTCGRDWKQNPPLTEKEVYREKGDEDIKPLFSFNKK